MTTTETKQLPHSLEAEEGILGYMLQDPARSIDAAISLISETAFFIRIHQLLFRLISELHKKGDHVDAITLTNFCQEKGVLKDVGGAYGITRIAVNTVMMAPLEEYCLIIREKQRLRDLIDWSARVQSAAYQATDSLQLISDTEIKLFNLAQTAVFGENQLLSASQRIDERIQRMTNGEKFLGLQTGIVAFDTPSLGFQPGEVYTFAAPPGYGKTALAEQMLVKQALDGVPCLFFSMEMNADRLLIRMACRLSGVAQYRLLGNQCGAIELKKFKEAKDRIEKSPLIILDDIDLTGAKIRSIVRNKLQSHGIKLFAVDYLQKVMSERFAEPKQIVTEAIRLISMATKETRCPSLVLSQMNREGMKDDKRPGMFHLSDSTQIERESDFIAYLWPEGKREELTPGEEQDMELVIRKNRNGPSDIWPKLYWNPPMMTYRDRII